MKKGLIFLAIWAVFMTGVHFYNWHNQIKFNASVIVARGTPTARDTLFPKYYSFKDMTFKVDPPDQNGVRKVTIEKR